MFTIDEIRRKAEAMERRAAEAGEADATTYLDLAMQWRLLEVEAAFMNAMLPLEEAEPPRP